MILNGTKIIVFFMVERTKFIDSINYMRLAELLKAFELPATKASSRIFLILIKRTLVRCLTLVITHPKRCKRRNVFLHAVMFKKKYHIRFSMRNIESRLLPSISFGEHVWRLEKYF